MNFEEWAAKSLLANFGIAIPSGNVVNNVADAAVCLHPSVVKAQIPVGARGKAGGILFADNSDEVSIAAEKLLHKSIAGHQVRRLLVEQRIDVVRELYAAVLTDRTRRCPIVLFSPNGGVDVEATASKYQSIRSTSVNILAGFDISKALAMVSDCGLGVATNQVADVLVSLYTAYRELDAELLEINPLALTTEGKVVALDCKLALDDNAIQRRHSIAALGTLESKTAIEIAAAEEGLRFVELDGNVGILANGAGLTMTTMDAVVHFGGSPANFLEIGGNAYTKAETALQLLLQHPSVRCLLVNFCGAFARTDVMAAGVVDAWKKLRPSIPVFFSIHGTGDVEAAAIIREQLGFEPFPSMDSAVQAAVSAANNYP